MTAPITDTVSLDITEDTVGVSRQGFGTPLLVSYTAGFTGVRTYNSLADVAVDFPTTTSYEYLAAQIAFSQSPKVRQLKIARGNLAPTQVATIGVFGSPKNSHAYTIGVKGDGVTTTAISSTSSSSATAAKIHNALVTALNAVVGKNFTAAFAALVVPDFTFTRTTGNVLSRTAHGLKTGDGPIQATNTGGALPSGMSAATDYWCIRLDDDTFSIATSLANALAGTAVTLSGAGTGTHTFSDTASTKRPEDPFLVTADAAGEWFSLEVNRDDLSHALTHADPGIATDLAAIMLADQDWYCLLTPSNSNAYVLAAAAWIEANSRIYFADITHSSSITAVVGGAGTDVLDNLHTLAYKRTAGFYHSSSAACVAVGIASRYLCTEPGAAIVKFKRLVGLVPVSLTATHRVNLRAKCGNWIEKSGGLSMIFDGRVALGGGSGWIDVTRDLDYLRDSIQTRVFGALASNDKIPQDNTGGVVIENELRGGLEDGVDRLIIFPGYTTELPDLDATEANGGISDTDRADRHLPRVKASVRLRGAIQSVAVEITVSL